MLERKGLRVAVTGAAGFIGAAVVDRIMAGALGPVAELRLNDSRPGTGEGAVSIPGSFVDGAVRRRLLGGGIDILFHLASLPGGAAKSDPALGKAVNLDGSIALLDAAAQGGAPVVVYASSIAALAKSAGPVGEATPLRPEGSYGAHKAMIELYLADLSQRGLIDGRSVRPAGIVARPREAFDGFATAWMSDLFHAAAEGRAVAVPARADTQIWLQSVDVAADNVVHAALLDAGDLPSHRAWTLPATVVRVGALVEALGRLCGRRMEVDYRDGPLDQPELDASAAQAVGFASDRSIEGLIDRVMARIGPKTHATAAL